MEFTLKYRVNNLPKLNILCQYPSYRDVTLLGVFNA